MKKLFKHNSGRDKERLNIRFTEEEWKDFLEGYAKSTCRSHSEYARKLLLEDPVNIVYRNQSFDDFEEQMAGVFLPLVQKYLDILEQRNLSDPIFISYNVQAYRGQPGTKLHESRGLLYRALDEKGHFIGRPLKASFFDFKPTLDKLEQKYAQNLTYKQEQKQRMEDKMIIALAQNPDNLADLRDSLTKDGVELSLRYDQAGNCTGMTAVDFKRRVVFTGDELEDRYNQRAIQQVVERQRLRESWELTHKHELRQSLRQSHSLRIY
jgi:hypothetical protein